MSEPCHKCGAPINVVRLRGMTYHTWSKCGELVRFCKCGTRTKQKRHEYWAKHWANATMEEKAKHYERLRNYRQKFRDKVLAHYGRRCACCGESIEEFLTIDHVQGGGNVHRRTLRAVGGATYKLYRWLVENNFPDGFQLLCFNCNIAKGQYGECPHERQCLNTQPLPKRLGN
jgi:hypothetical protein